MPDDKRMTKAEYYLDMAMVAAKRSTCLKRNYGAIIVKNDRIISTGYNGAPRGCTNCLEIGCPRMSVAHNTEYSTCRSVHAEMNALIHAKYDEMVGATLYLNGFDCVNSAPVQDVEPCPICRRMIINAQIKEVVVPDKTFVVADWVKEDVDKTGPNGFVYEMKDLYRSMLGRAGNFVQKMQSDNIGCVTKLDYASALKVYMENIHYLSYVLGVPDYVASGIFDEIMMKIYQYDMQSINMIDKLVFDEHIMIRYNKNGLVPSGVDNVPYTQMNVGYSILLALTLPAYYIYRELRRNAKSDTFIFGSGYEYLHTNAGTAISPSNIKLDERLTNKEYHVRHEHIQQLWDWHMSNYGVGELELYK